MALLTAKLSLMECGASNCRKKINALNALLDSA